MVEHMRHNDEKLEQDIKQTRRDMDKTLDNLITRLEPRSILLELVDSLFPAERAHVAGRKDAIEKLRASGLTLKEQAQASPIPFALIGLGAVWLGYDLLKERRYGPNHGRAGESTVDARTGQPYTPFYGAEHLTEAERAEQSQRRRTDEDRWSS